MSIFNKPMYYMYAKWNTNPRLKRMRCTACTDKTRQCPLWHAL